MYYRAKAPLRVSFCGGGTDIPDYYTDHGGVVLSTTINKYSYVNIIPKPTQKITIKSFDFNKTITFNVDQVPLFDGVLDLAKAAIRYAGVPTGFDLYMHTDAPPGSGLGSSSSMTVALIGALNEWLEKRSEPYEIAELAYQIERIDLKVSGGKQDQYAAAFGGFNLIEFYKDRVIVTPLRIKQEILNELEYHFILCYTGGTRLSAGLIDEIVKYYKKERRATLEGMKELKEITYRMKDALVKGNMVEFSDLMVAAGEAKEKMNPHITNDHINQLYQEARAAGAKCGKILGAGGGGFMLLFCPIEKKKKITERMESLGTQVISFSYNHQGMESWRSNCF